jgi:hypothetical protein
MRKYLFLILFVIFTVCLSADLTDVYKRGTIRLSPDPEFGKNTDWKTIFPVASGRNIVIAEDGSIYVGRSGQNNVYKFDKDGNFLKEFIEKAKISKSVYSWLRPTSILDDNFVVVKKYDKICLYNQNGSFVKSLKMEYPITDCLALKDNKIALAGSVLYKGGRFKRLVGIKDVDTEKENILSYFMDDFSKGTVQIKLKDNISVGFGNPLSRIRVFVERSPEGNLIAGYSHKPEIIVYSPDGERLKSFNLNINPLKISEKVREEYYEGVQKTVKKYDLPEDEIKKIMARQDLVPEYRPYFYDLMVDPEGNILVFIYTEENGTHTFQVYSSGGIFICESVIDPGDFQIKISPNTRNLVFFKGYLYALVRPNKTDSGFSRLIKVKLTEDN